MPDRADDRLPPRRAPLHAALGTRRRTLRCLGSLGGGTRRRSGRGGSLQENDRVETKRPPQAVDQRRRRLWRSPRSTAGRRGLGRPRRKGQHRGGGTVLRGDSWSPAGSIRKEVGKRGPGDALNTRTVAGRGREHEQQRPAGDRKTVTIDPITLEVLRHRFDAIADNMESTLVKCATSPSVKEGADCSVALFDTGGNTVAQGLAIPVHLGSMPPAVKSMLAKYPPQSLKGRRHGGDERPLRRRAAQPRHHRARPRGPWRRDRGAGRGAGPPSRRRGADAGLQSDRRGGRLRGGRVYPAHQVRR